MKPNFSDFESDSNPTNSKLENLETDCFELLSAYIDGELSPEEKQKVQAWLDQDPQVKTLYTKLLSLQRQIKCSSAPPSQKSVEEITTGVFQTISAARHRWRRNLIFNTSMITAIFLVALVGNFNSNNSGLQIAKTDNSSISSKVTMLAVSVNKPAINIPKTALDNSFD